MATDTLRDVLADWSDYDSAGFDLGKILGVFSEGTSFGSVKRMFWGDGYPLGDMLVDVLDRMAETGVLLKNEDRQYRWNPYEPDRSRTRDDVDKRERSS